MVLYENKKIILLTIILLFLKKHLHKSHRNTYIIVCKCSFCVGICL